MSWHAELDGDDWNYTHNCNAMIAKVLDTLGFEMRSTWWDDPAGIPTAWWRILDGMSGADGEKLLGAIVGGLMEAPELFRSMNPKNGWGDYDSLLAVLVEMRDWSAEYPDGRWETSG